MKIQKKAQQGFTLIELMIVIAIVGILAAIALPAYQDYIIRSKMSEALAAMAEAKTTVAEYTASNGKFPAASTSFGLNTSDRFDNSDILQQLDIDPATFTVGTKVPVYIVAEIFTSLWDGNAKNISNVLMFQLSGTTNSDGTMSWTCLPGKGNGKATPVPLKYLPANCRG